MAKRTAVLWILCNLVLGVIFLLLPRIGVALINGVDTRAYTFLFCGFAMIFMGFLSRYYYKQNIKVESDDAEINYGAMIGFWTAGGVLSLGMIYVILSDMGFLPK